ncbi:MAG: PaaI family thioesterase [Pseudomonadales bacterium]|nr:PaaI family thioesterase [Pseudomonadales bacterium]
MSLPERVKQARENHDFAPLIEMIPYARLIGMSCLNLGEEVVFVFPPLEDNIGNPTLPAIHGGVIGGFMENAAIFHALAKLELFAMPKVVDFSLDYLRPGRYQTTYANCSVVRQGRKVVNVSVTAWQNRRDEPIANARTHLLFE